MKERQKEILREKFGVQHAELLIKKIELQEELNNLHEEQKEKERIELFERAIPKKDLKTETVYEGICERLEYNKTAMWNGEKFIVKKYEFGWFDFEIDHIEDVIHNNYAGFAPLKIQE